MKKILAIDDQMDNLISIKAVLETYMPDCRVMLAQTGSEGIEVALKEKPDVILLDIIMPVMDGYEICRKLKSSKWTSNIPIIMVTAIKTDVESRIRGLELGADAFLSKPYDPTELSAQIRVMLRIKAAEDKLRQERDELDKLVDIKTEQIKYQATLLQNVVDAVVATDMDFIITSWNNAAEELYGWKADEVIGKQIGQVLKPEYLDHSRDEVINFVLKNKHYRGELIHYHKDGTAIRISGSASLIINNSGINIGCVTLYRDITEQVKAQRALRESEEQFRMLANTTTAGIFIHAGGNFLYINEATSAASGYTIEELYSKKFIEFVYHEDREMVNNYWKQRISGEKIPFSYITRLNKKGGGFIWAEISANLIDYKGEKALIGTAFNVTDRVVAEMQIKESEKKFRMLFQNLSTGFALHEIILDKKGKPADYRFLEINPAFEQLTGLNADAIIGKTCLEIMPETEAFWIETYGKVALGEKPVTFENFSQVLNRYYHVTAYSPEPNKFATIFLDITDRKKAEEEIQKVGRHYQSLIEKAADGIVLIGTDGNYKYISSSARKMFGYEPTEVITSGPADSTHPEDLPMVLEELGKIIADPDYIPTIQYRFCEKNGNWKWIESTFRNLYAEPSVEAIVINFRDITERIIGEKKLKETDARFRKLSEHVPGMIYQFKRTPDGIYTAPFSSEAIKDIFGCNPEDVFDSFNPIGEKIIPEDFNKVVESIELSAKNLTKWECEYRVNVDGKIKWLYGQSTPEKMPDGSIIWHGYNSDITDRKQLENKILKNKALLAATEKTGKIGGWEFDPKTLTQEWTEETFNILEIDLTNGEPAVPEGLGFINEPYRRNAEKAIQRAIEFGEPYDQEWEITTAKGNIKWVHAVANINKKETGEVKNIYGSFQDITERKKVEEELRLSRHIIEGIINAIPVRVFWKDKDLKYIGCNVAFAKDAGCSNPEDLIGKDDFQMVWKEQADNYRKDDFDVIKDGKPKLHIEEPQTTPNGDIITLLTSKIPLRDSKGEITGVLGTYMDITERKLAEAALIESELKFRAIFENNSAAIAIINPDTTISMVNDAYCNISGYNKEEVIGMSWTKQIHPDDLERLKEYNRLRLSDPANAPEKYEFKFYKKNGEITDALMSVSLIQETKQIITSFIDITARKKSEQALIESEEKFYVAFKTSPYAITITKPEDGVIVEANDAFFTLTGYSEKETLNHSTVKLGLWADIEVRNKVLSTIINIGQVNDEEVRFIRKNGSILYGLFSAQIITLKGKRLILSSINDITERILAEDRIKQITKNWNLTFDSIQDGICLLDINNQIIQSNKAFHEFVKKTPNDIQFLKCFEIVHEKDCHEPDCPFSKMKLTKKRETSEMKLGEFFCEIIVDPIFNEQEEITGAVHIIKNISKQKEDQAALIASENKYRLIAENTADVIWSMDMNMNFTFTSPAVHKLRGYTTEESLKMPLEKILTPESYIKVMDIFSQQTDLIINNKFDPDTTIIVELDQYNKDGTIIKTENTISVLFNKDNIPVNILGITRDITERKKAEDELNKNEIRLKGLVGILQYKNADSQEFLDLALDEAIKVTESDIGYIYYYLADEKVFILNTWSKKVMNQCKVINPQTRYELDKTGIWGEVVRQGVPILINDYKAPDPLKKGYPEGHVELTNFLSIPIYNEEKIVAVVGVGNKKTDYNETDILELQLLMDVVWKANEHKRAEISLIKSEEKFRTLVENLPVGIYRSTPEGKLISVNSAYKEMLEIETEQDMIGINVIDTYFKKDDRAQFIEAISKKGYFSNYEVQLQTLKKKVFWVSISGITIKDENGKILFIDGVISNIDDRKKSEELVEQKTIELQEHKDHLEELVKSRTAELERSMIAAEAATKAKSEFLANMSHEIRTPMNAIVGFSELLQSAVNEPKQLSQVNSIRTSAKSLMGIINDILDLSKVEAGKMKLEFAPVNIKSIIHEIESVFKAKIVEKGLVMKTIYGKDLPSTLVLDEIRIRQVLFNLVGNAVKFTDNGSINLSVSCMMKKEKNNFIDLIFSVEDTGIGIPPEQQELIFEAFSQVKGQNTKKYGGTGLGLTITKRLVEIMNGSIVLSSNLGTGSVFEVHIPDVEVSEEQTIISSDNVYNPRSVKFEMAKILICDDNENNRDLIIDLLENSELEIFEAENGKQAVQYATEFLPDLILMDLKMPEIDGYEATKILKNNKATAKIPIIALSASATMINQSSIENNLFSATIIKPINIYQLIKSLKLFLKFSELEIDNKTESQKDEILIMTKEMLKSMPEAISTLETYFLPESLKAVEEQNIDKIEIFAKKIIAFGEKFSLNTIICFGNELSSYAENFEIDKISEAMAGFKSIINNIKSTFEEMRRSE